MRPGWIVLFALAAIAGIAVVAQAQGPRPAAEQKLFPNGAIRHPVNLSPEVLKALLATKQVQAQFAVMDSTDTKNPSQFFRAAEVHLNQSSEVDLVVVGVSPMAGADNTWFWVVRSARKDPKVILFSNGSTLEVLDTKTNGYGDIRSVWSSAARETDTTIYHFDGSDYRPWEKRQRLAP
jgi:hypothetical protein